MKIQKSRNSQQARKDYSAVCHQQGRMLTDSDLTEQALISRERLNKALQDVIGSGSPRHDGLLQVIELGDERIPSLHWGRVYADGVPAEVRPDNETTATGTFEYAHQLYYPDAPPLPASAYRLYADVWERVVIWLEDDMLRDPGLHGADTTTRTQTVAQVKWCAATTDPLCPDINPPIGNARLRLVLRSLSSSADPCDPCADELELNDPVGNYLFRVEIHDVHYDDNDLPDALVLKWSAENGAEAYKTSNVPPDFASNQYVYEFFDDVTEKRLGVHLGRDSVSNGRIIDGNRPGLVATFTDSSPTAKDYVRRWDGWCRLEKNGANWQVTQGFEGSIDLNSGVGAGKPGHVTQGGDAVTIELRIITLDIELADHALVSGDYWITPVRETIHQQGEVLLEDPAGGGSLPQGERHHYLLLVDVADDDEMSLPAASECDAYQACRLPQFPSLTDLRAGDICYDNSECQMPEVRTVQDALDHLCQENGLPWHNKHLHGWGIVCGLTLECDVQTPSSVILRSGYALDCEGMDMVIRKDVFLDIPQLLAEAGIDPQALDDGQGVCLYLERTGSQALDVRAELYLPDQRSDWLEKLRDTLLYDFYQDCILELIKVFRQDLSEGEVQARCVLTECGKQHIPPVRRRTFTLATLLFHQNNNELGTVLNISPCEHLLLRDLYEKLKSHLRSKTFCAQFEDAVFPKYPFEDHKLCRATWFTPEQLDHIRVHPKGHLVLGWKRNSQRIYVFQQLEDGCAGDLLGYMDVPKLESGSITDLSISVDNVIHLSGIIHQQDTLFARGKLDESSRDGCEFKVDWQTSFLCGMKVVQLKPSPWGEAHFYAVALCRGAYLFSSETLFANEKIGDEPHWAFAASGHIDFDTRGKRVFASAFEREETHAGIISRCEEGYYNRVVLFHSEPIVAEAPPVITTIPLIRKLPLQGSDGFVIASSVLYLVVEENNSRKLLCRFPIPQDFNQENSLQWHGEEQHSFDSAGHVSLAYLKSDSLDGVVAARHAMHDMQYIPSDPQNSALLRSIPVQAGPVAIAINEPLQQVYVLNHVGQSITVLNHGLSSYQEQRGELQDYRNAVIAAFYQLLGGVLQYLKDCFCHHLLVKCPECSEDDKVYLGCLRIEDNAVQHICNFTKRKYVKSFPTLSYWLSLIPVEPLVAWLVEEFCCLVLPNRFRDRDSRKLSLGPMQMGMAKAVMSTDQSRMLTELSAKGQVMFREGMTNLIGTGYKDKSSYQDTVELKYTYKPGVFKVPKPALVSDKVLVAKVQTIDEQVLVNSEKAAALEAELDNRFSALENDYQNVLVKRVDTIVVEKTKADQEIASLKEKITVLEQQKIESDQRVATLEEAIKNLQPAIIGLQPVSSIRGIKREQVERLEGNGIRTVGQLAEAKVEQLMQLGFDKDPATKLIEQAQRKLNGEDQE